jgi:hypothetical protein
MMAGMGSRQVPKCLRRSAAVSASSFPPAGAFQAAHQMIRSPLVGPIFTSMATSLRTRRYGIVTVSGQRSARRVPDRRERPGRTQPLRHGLVQHHVERGMVRADPRPHISNGSIGSVGRIGSIGIDVHAPDDLVAAGRAHRIREPRTPGEVRGVPFQVAQVLRQRHVRHRPRPPLEPRSRPDMGNAGGPGPVVVLIVLRPQRLKPESLTRQRTRHVKVVRYEAHRHTLTRGHGGRGAHGQPHLGQRLGRGQRPPAELLEPADPGPSARSRRPRRRCSGTRTTCWPPAATTPSPTRCSG